MNLQTNTHTHVSFRMNCVYVFRMLLLMLMQMPTLEWSVCRILLMQVIVLQLITKGQERLSRQQFDINAPANVHTQTHTRASTHSRTFLQIYIRPSIEVICMAISSFCYTKISTNLWAANRMCDACSLISRLFSMKWLYFNWKSAHTDTKNAIFIHPTEQRSTVFSFFSVFNVQ